MAVTITTVLDGVTMHIADVAASADADTTATIPHTLSGTPLLAIAQQLTSQALTALSAWAITTIDATNVVATKLTSVGSGSAPAQLRVLAWLPHTVAR